jgi:hypothetical protein
MKNVIKFFAVATILVVTAGQLNAQSGRTVEQAKLPSKRPLPDKMMIVRKFEMMRINAQKQQAQTKLTEQEKAQLLKMHPADLHRPAQKATIN